MQHLVTRTEFSDDDIKIIMEAQADRWWTNVFTSVAVTEGSPRKCRHCSRRNENVAHILTMSGTLHPDSITSLVKKRHNQGVEKLAHFIDQGCDQWEVIAIEGKHTNQSTHQIISDYRQARQRPDLIISNTNNGNIYVLDITFAQDRGLIQEDEWNKSTNRMGPHWDQWDKYGILKDKSSHKQTDSAPFHPHTGKRQKTDKVPFISSRARYYHRYTTIASLNQAKIGVIAIGVCGWVPSLTRQILWDLEGSKPPTNKFRFSHLSPDSLLKDLSETALKFIPLIYRKWTKSYRKS